MRRCTRGPWWGNGFPSLQACAGSTSRLDPRVFFGVLSATRYQARDKGGFECPPRNSDGLRLGTAPVPTDDVNAFLELGGSAVLTPSTAIDIVFAAGLTCNTPDFRLMVSLPVRVRLTHCGP